MIGRGAAEADMGMVCILAIVVLVVVAAALAKYLRSGNQARREREKVRRGRAWISFRRIVEKGSMGGLRRRHAYIRRRREVCARAYGSGERQ